MGADEEERVGLSRRGFLGVGAAVLTAVAVPGATLLLTEQSAAAAVSPYAMTTWQDLLQQRVQVSAADQSSVSLQVVKVTPLAFAARMAMTGDSFMVNFKAPGAMASKIYSVTAPRLGTFPLFLGGSGSMAHAVINRRVPA